ncbi:protein of unknown function [Stenotrophomonas maltophilia]|nr:protein of unknown function [Stenotrophomonas maltophilia]
MPAGATHGDAGWQAHLLKANTGFEARPPFSGGTPSEPLALCNANQKSCKHHSIGDAFDIVLRC